MGGRWPVPRDSEVIGSGSALVHFWRIITLQVLFDTTPGIAPWKLQVFGSMSFPLRLHWHTCANRCHFFIYMDLRRHIRRIAPRIFDCLLSRRPPSQASVDQIQYVVLDYSPAHRLLKQGRSILLGTVPWSRHEAVGISAHKDSDDINQGNRVLILPNGQS
jgi:hypothetical protein